MPQLRAKTKPPLHFFVKKDPLSKIMLAPQLEGQIFFLRF